MLEQRTSELSAQVSQAQQAGDSLAQKAREDVQSRADGLLRQQQLEASHRIQVATQFLKTNK